MPSREPGVLRNRNFILLLSAYAISAFGDHLSELGIMAEMHIKEGTEQTRIGALMLFCFFLPYVLLGPLAGAVADRLPRRAIMITADVLRAGIAFAIPFFIHLLDDPRSSLMVLPILGLGIFASFFNPARLSYVPQIVEDRHLTQANSMLNGLAPIAAIISYVIGGQLAAAALTDLNFISDGATFLVSAVLLLSIVQPRASGIVATRQRMLADIVGGFRYISTHRNVWQLMIFTAAFWTAAGIFRSVLPTVVFTWYESDIDVLGYLQASLGIGMLAGAVIMTLLADASRPHYNIIAALLGAGLMVLTFSLTDAPSSGALCGAGVGLFGVWIVITANTMLQRIVPDHARGKVFGIVDLVNMAGMVAATGILADPFRILNFHNLDQHVDWILRGLGGALVLLGIATWRHHARRSRFPVLVSLMTCLNEVVCRYWYRMQRVGPCTVPVSGPCIITANHVCPVDPCFMVAGSPNRIFGFMIAREYYNVPIWRHLIHYLQCIPVRRDGHDIAATKEAIRQLRSGKALAIFIQGGIQDAHEDLCLRDGVAVLALRTGVPVIPVHISGAKYHDSVFRSYLMRHKVRVRYGPPVDLSAYTNARDRQQVADATDKIWSSVQALAPPEVAGGLTGSAL